MGTRLGTIFLLFVVLTACSTVPTRQNVRATSESEARISGMSRVAIVSDAFFFKDVLGDDDYWLVEESRAAADHMLSAAKRHLEGKGFSVSSASVPFIGAFKKRDQLFKVRDDKGAEITDKYPPVFEHPELAANPAYRDALLSIIPKIPATLSINDVCCTQPNDRDLMAIISANISGDATLFIIGNGTIVSTGKQLTQGLTTGLLTAALTLGTFSVVRYNVSVMETFAVLVSNSTGEILWSNFMRFKEGAFTGGEYYEDERWPRNVLYHFPSKTPPLTKTMALSTDGRTPAPDQGNANPSSKEDAGTITEDKK